MTSPVKEVERVTVYWCEMCKIAQNGTPMECHDSVVIGWFEEPINK